MLGRRRLVGVLVLTTCLCVPFTTVSATRAGASAATPTVTPAPGGGGVPVVPGFTTFDPKVVGYREAEFFLSGTASAYTITAPVANDGKYRAVAVSAAPYTTRAVVMRPADPRRFNGTVVVEWLNVSGLADNGPDWTQAHTEMIREGFVWVGVSAQKVGVDALKSDQPPTGDPTRYAGLSHPGDDYSYDIFSQAGQAIHDDARTMLGGLKPKKIVATGESQSAIRLVTYIDAVHPLVNVYDGFLVHSRAGGAPIRDDVGVPVLVFMTQTDVSFSNGAARQPDSGTYRLWEVAGTAHYDYYGLALGPADTGAGRAGSAVLASMQHPTDKPPGPNFTCDSPINSWAAHYVLDAAVYHLNRWVTKGIAPPIAPRFQLTTTNPVVFATDAHGNALGGIRTPAVDAPVATLTGTPPGGTSFCFLFGTTTAFTPAQIAALYPSHRKFVAAWTRATNSARAAGFLVAPDARELISAAVHSDIGK
jgi:hypothetical protein